MRVTEVRASDFIGRGAMSNFSIMVAPKVVAGRAALFPADLDAPHSWTGTTDAARTLIAVGQDDRAWGRRGTCPTTGRCPRASSRQRSPSTLSLAGLFSPIVGELPEMQYQLQRPFIVDSSLTEETFGLKPAPLDDFLAEMARGLIP